MNLTAQNIGWQLGAGLYLGLVLIWFLLRVRRVKRVRQLAVIAALLICVLASFLFGNWLIRITAIVSCIYGIVRFAPDESTIIRRWIASVLTKVGAANLAQRVWTDPDDDVVVSS
jgi:hypothetical protein